MHLTQVLTLKSTEVITGGYWTKLAASPPGCQSPAAHPAGFFIRFIQCIVLYLSADLQGAQLLVTDQGKGWLWSFPHKNPQT